MVSDCLFCKIIKGEVPSAKVYEDDKVLAFLDIKPVNPGHVLVVPKEHYAGIVEALEETLSAIMFAVKKIAPAVLKAVKAKGFNLGVNNGSDAGQLVPHLHFHIIPRHLDDGHKLWDVKSYANGDMEKIKTEIVKNL